MGRGEGEVERVMSREAVRGFMEREVMELKGIVRL